MSVQIMTSVQLGDGKPQIFALTDQGLASIWKQTPDPDSLWSGWYSFESPAGRVSSLAATNLTDKRPLILAATDQGMWTNSKPDTNPDGPWIGWQRFEAPQGRVVSIAACTLPTDGRPQIVVETEQGMWSIWKLDTNPDGPWSGWQKFDDVSTAFPSGPR